jgi:hypothetical protein
MSGGGGIIKDLAGSDSFFGKDNVLGGNRGQIGRTVAAGGAGVLLNSMQGMGSKARGQASEEAEAARDAMPKPSKGMPYVDPAKIAQNKSRRFANLQRQSGRQSTLLTNTSNTFG